MDQGTRKEYLRELRQLRFYINEGKPFNTEAEKVLKQLKVVNMKLEQKRKELQEFEEKNFGDNQMSTTQLKVKIERMLKVQLDTKKMSVTEWHEWVNEALQTKAA